MTILHLLTWNLFAPALVAAAAIACCRRAGRGRSGVAAGLALGYVAGQWGLFGWPGLSELDANRPTAWLVLAAAVLGIVEASRALPRRTTWAARAALVASLLALLLRPRMESGREAVEAGAWLFGLWAAVLATWWNLEEQGQRLTGPGWVVPLGLIALGWGAVLAISGDAGKGQLEGVLAASLLGALPTVGLRPGPALSKGGAAVASTVLGGLGVAGFFDSGVPVLAALLLVLAPWALWVDRIGVIRRRSYWTRSAIRCLAVLLAVGAAVIAAEAGTAPGLDPGSA